MWSKLVTWLIVSAFACGLAQVLDSYGVDTASASDERVEAQNNIYHILNRDEENVESSEEEETNEITDIESELDPEAGAEDGSAETTSPVGKLVQTTQGPVQGYYYNNTGNIMAYIDIPYGKFHGHFQPPVEPDSWVEVHEVQVHTSACPQAVDSQTIKGDVNCLTMSVFTPIATENAPVLFHIHDGNFKYGSGDPAFYGPEYLVPKGVVLVLPNYRLGPLGFLCIRNGTAPGNAGLKDLTLALYWIVNNIAEFGGDPSNIAVSGEGLAGILVGYLTLSPISSLYINKVITESGSVLSQLAIDRDPVNTALHLADLLMNKEEPSLLTEASLEDLILYSNDMIFLPCVEETKEAFMDVTPWSAIQQTILANKTFMIGSANRAGLQDFLSHTPESVQELSSDVSNFLPNDLCFSDNAQRIREAENIRRQYFEDSDITVDDIEKLSLYYTDVLYLGPSIRTARSLINAGATVYFYEFSYVGSMNWETLNMPVQLVAGAAKGDLAAYVFTKQGEMPAEGSLDEMMVNLMTDVWVSFVNTGRPAAGVTWNELRDSEPEDEEWLSIGLNASVERGVHVSRLALWTRLYREHYIENAAAHRVPGLALAIAIFLLSGYSYERHC